MFLRKLITNIVAPYIERKEAQAQTDHHNAWLRDTHAKFDAHEKRFRDMEERTDRKK